MSGILSKLNTVDNPIAMNTYSDKDTKDAITKFGQFLYSNKVEFILTGPSGSGKSSLVQRFIDSIDDLKEVEKVLGTSKNSKLNKTILITAMTHVALNQLKQKLRFSFMNSTFHSLLGIVPEDEEIYYDRERRNGKDGLELVRKYRKHLNRYKKCIIFIDEASMLTTFHRHTLMNDIDTATCKVVYILDKDQLRSVSDPGFSIAEQNITTAELTTIRRQKSTSNGIHPIAQTAENFRQAIHSIEEKFLPIPYNGVELIHCNGAEFKAAIHKSFLNNYTKKTAAVSKVHVITDIRNNKILSWTNNKTDAYNDYIQDKLFEKPVRVFPYGANTKYSVLLPKISEIWQVKGSPEIEDFELVYIKNVVTEKSIDGKTLLKIKVRVQDLSATKSVKTVTIFKHGSKINKAQLLLPYASTVHKSQGSTYENVFLDLDDICKCRNFEDVARMLYVAISRASEKVYIKGSIPAKWLQ